MKSHIFRQIVREAKATLGLASSLIFPLVLILTIADRSTAIGGFMLERELTVAATAVAIGEQQIPGDGIVQRIVVGVPTQYDEKRAVHIYRYDTGTMKWREEQELTASDGEAKGDGFYGDNFGNSVAIDGGPRGIYFVRLFFSTSSRGP